MDIRQQFPDVHWIWKGAISFVYEVHPRIVVKVPKSGDFEREQFRRELNIYNIFSQNPPCPSIVQCFLCADNGIFLEYMRDVTLCSRIQINHTRDQQVVTKVDRLEPLPLRKKWVNDLAQAVAFLESLRLAHGDLRPENILLDRDRLKLADFDCTAEIGSDFEACMAPYGRLLNSDEQDQGQGRRGSSGFLGPRTEQFALGSIYYLINYGFEVYGDQRLTEDHKEHGRKVVELLQNMEFPKLAGDPLMDDIITRCWHNRYATMAELAANTEMLLLPGRSNGRDTEAEKTTTTRQWRTIVSRIVRGMGELFTSCWRFVLCRIREATKLGGANSEMPDGDGRRIGQHDSAENFSGEREFCQNLDRRGLVYMLSSGEPEQLGFSLEWYRHSIT